MRDLLEQLMEETIEKLLKQLPAERLVKGLSPDELMAALSPETRAALAERLKDSGLLPKPQTKEPENGGPKP